VNGKGTENRERRAKKGRKTKSGERKKDRKPRTESEKGAENQERRAKKGQKIENGERETCLVLIHPPSLEDGKPRTVNGKLALF
jgi:hypothetical protein